MTTILMANYPNSLVRSNLFNLSNNTVLLLREAQVKGSSIDAQRNALGVDTVTGYGIYFDKINNKIIYFNDKGNMSSPGNKVYDAGNGEAISTVNIVSGYLINKLRIKNNDSSNSYSDTDSLTVTFTRPSVKAFFTPITKEVCVELTTKKNPALVRSIQVYSLGRIVSGPKECP